MTLCIAWRDAGTVHFASDSRLTLGNHSYADVGIKVLSLPYAVLDPVDQNGSPARSVAFNGELGMCFAGSAVNSFMLKECVVEVLKTLQHAPGYTDTSMSGIARFIFSAYKLISNEICKTALGGNGRASILVGGYCRTERRVRVFKLSTDGNNNHELQEVLIDKPHIFVGTPTSAEEDVPQTPTDRDYIDVLKSVIADPSVPTVGGHVQYGRFQGDRFIVHGIYEFDSGGPHYWRGALDLNSRDFMSDASAFVPGITYIDFSKTVLG